MSRPEHEGQHEPTRCGAAAARCASDAMQTYEARQGELGGVPLRRALPLRQRRLVGPWCFLDHFGPANLPGMDVGPHPHIGLQTVTWLLDGAVVHHDSLGVEQRIEPGQLNVMTSGDGIAHAELTPPVPAHADDGADAMRLHGAQLWVALPEASRPVEPGFEHVAELPRVRPREGVVATVFAGEWLGSRSPARYFSPIVGAELSLSEGYALPLREDFEHALLTLQGGLRVAGFELGQGRLCYLAPGREQVRVDVDEPATVLLIGGAPFGEEIMMWWNFVGRTREELARARDDWETGADRFSDVVGVDRPRLPAPPWTGGR